MKAGKEQKKSLMDIFLSLRNFKYLFPLKAGVENISTSRLKRSNLARQFVETLSWDPRLFNLNEMGIGFLRIGLCFKGLTTSKRSSLSQFKHQTIQQALSRLIRLKQILTINERGYPFKKQGLDSASNSLPKIRDQTPDCSTF